MTQPPLDPRAPVNHPSLDPRTPVVVGVGQASEPKISVTSLPPRAMTAANSLTRCCGACPPLTSRTARAGLAAIRPATDRG